MYNFINKYKESNNSLVQLGLFSTVLIIGYYYVDNLYKKNKKKPKNDDSINNQDPN